MELKTALELPAEINSKPCRGQTLTAASEKGQLSKQGGTAGIPSLTINSQGCFNFCGHNSKIDVYVIWIVAIHCGVSWILLCELLHPYVIASLSKKLKIRRKYVSKTF